MSWLWGRACELPTHPASVLDELAVLALKVAEGELGKGEDGTGNNRGLAIRT